MQVIDWLDPLIQVNEQSGETLPPSIVAVAVPGEMVIGDAVPVISTVRDLLVPYW